jgi:TetR/AcrR family transcriptional regulator, transcriptional repressor for nem operon
MSGDQAESDSTRPDERDPDVRRRIVTAAIDLLRVVPIGALEMADIRRASGVSEAQLRAAFVDKPALVEAIALEQTEAVLSRQGPELRSVASLRDLRWWLDRLVEQNESSGGIAGCPIGSLVGELADRYEAGHRALVKGFTDWKTLLAAALGRIRDNGELPPHVDPDALATGIMAALQGGFLLARVSRDSRRLAATLGSVLDFLDMSGP